jgi:hypothetical protein
MERSSVALGTVDGIRTAVTIPIGEIVKVVSGPTEDGNPVIDVLWDGRILTMFAVDLLHRATELPESRQYNQGASA